MNIVSSFHGCASLHGEGIARTRTHTSMHEYSQQHYPLKQLQKSLFESLNTTAILCSIEAWGYIN